MRISAFVTTYQRNNGKIRKEQYVNLNSTIRRIV